MRIVSMALNVPGPVAIARLVAAGAKAVKIEPPWGDPLSELCRSWYDDLHRGVTVERLDLKSSDGAATARGLLADADLFLASQRPSALARLGLDAVTLRATFPSLRHLNIVGDSTNPEEPGHDLTYQARAGLLQRTMPLTLVADMVGAERAFGAVQEAMQHPGASRVVGLYDALQDLAAPLRYGLTAGGGPLSGRNPAYAIYAAREGTIAVGALEPHFRARLYDGLEQIDGADLSQVFLTRTALEWERWATERDLPLVAVRNFSER